MPNTTKNGYLVERGTQNPYAVKTKTSLVDDIAKGHALSQTLINTPDKDALGYPAFSTVTAYTTGQIVYYNNKLWKFTMAHTAGGWNANEVEQYDIKMAIEDADATFKSGEKVKDVSLEDYAQKDGNYPVMTVGKAYNLTGEPITVTTGYTLKPTGFDPTQPELEFADGQVNMTDIEGRACAWNQLFQTSRNNNTSDGITLHKIDDTSFYLSGTATRKDFFALFHSLIVGHKYYFSVPTAVDGIRVEGLDYVTAKRTVLTATKQTISWGVTLTKDKVFSDAIVYRPLIIDITLLNPALAATLTGDASTKETEGEIVEAYLASIMQPKPYYNYNAGQLLGARMIGWKTLKTPNLLNPTTKQAKLFEYAYTGHDNEYTIKNLPSDAEIKFVENKVGNLPARTNLAENVEWVVQDINSSLSVNQDGSLRVTRTVEGSTNFDLRKSLNLTSEHKLYIKVVFKSSISGEFNSLIGNNYSNNSVQVNAGEISYLKTLATVPTHENNILVRIISRNHNLGTVSVGGYFDVYYTELIDLTETFGTGNEPTTVAEAEASLYGIVTPDLNGHFTINSRGVAKVVNKGDLQSYNGSGNLATTWLIATWDGSKDDMENFKPYEESNADIDSANIYWDNSGTMTQVFEGGTLKSTGDSDVRDKVWFDKVEKKWKSVVNVGDVNLETLDYALDSDYDVFVSSEVINIKNSTTKIICSRYIPSLNPSPAVSNISDKEIYVGINSTVSFKDSSLSASDIIDNKIAKLAGVHLFYELATPITHDTLYYKVGNEYVPMEEMFPDGITNFGCNWATETLAQEAEVDGQPQSITPITTEVFQSDYKELLKTIGETYISKEEAKDSFDNFLSVLNTNSGTALGGTYATDGFNEDGSVKFTFTPAT